MNKQQLNAAFDKGLVVHFHSKDELYRFMQEIKSFGGKWSNTEEITLPEIPNKLQNVSHLHVDRNYTLSILSPMCYHVGVYPTIEYRKFTNA